MATTIHPISTRRDRERFIKLQWNVYNGEPNWTAPLLYDRRKILDPEKNPFFRHGLAQLYIAEKNGKPAGRIAAIINENHNIVHADKVGFFGFFECIDDQEVADALFAEAGKWLKAHGKDVMRGPMNPSVNDDIGMLVKGFEQPAVILMPYNPDYYPGLVENNGFAKAKDLFAYRLRHATVMTPKLMRVQQAVRERHGITIRDFDFSRIRDEIKIVKDLYNRGWEKNWGAVALDDAELDALAGDLKMALSGFHEFAFFCCHHEEPVGFALTLPDINQILIHNRRGRLLPGLWRLKTRRKLVTQMRIMVLGLLPEHRGLGYDSVMYFEIIDRADKRGVHTGEASWVLEDNTMMNRAAKLMNADAYKTYRIYDKSI